MTVDFARKFKELRDFFDLTQVDLAKEIGLTRSAVSQIEIGRFDPTINVISSISVKFDIDLKYFFNDSLTIRESVKNYKVDYKVETKNGDKKPLKVVSESNTAINDQKGVPYYEQLLASAGNFNDIITNSTVTSYLNLPQISDCTAVIPVHGSSMKGLIEPGDLIAIKELATRTEFDPALPYLVITNEHRMVKYLRADTEDNTVIWAESTNHKPIKLSVDNILYVYAIKCVIRLF